MSEEPEFFDPKELRAGKKVKQLPIIFGPVQKGYFWAGESLTFEDARKHFIVVGATGSGKSITLNMLMKSVFSKIVGKDEPPRRGVVYDSKADLVSMLSAFVSRDSIVILNPLDDRCVPWDIASDIKTETDAHEFASILIPKNEKETSPYFSDTARSLVSGVIKRFNAPITGGKPWTLRDLVLAFESTKRLRLVLDCHETQYLLDHFHRDNRRNFAGVKSTVDNVLSQYRPIAALFELATKKLREKGKLPLSLNRWLNSTSILVLGNHESAREATDTLNRLMFRQLSKLIVVRHGRIEGDETWIFLDELREAGVLPGLRQLLLRGRSKGVAVAIGFQDVEGIYATYGEHEGAEIIGTPQNAAVLHLNPTAPKTTEWASSVFGSRRDLTPGRSESYGREFQQCLVSIIGSFP